MENTITNVTMDIETFIVPNSACLVSKLWDAENEQARFEEICELNDIEFDTEKDHILQLWFVDPNGSENMGDHGFEYKGGDDRYSFQMLWGLPECIFRDHVEGDVVTLKIPMKPRFKFHQYGETFLESTATDYWREDATEEAPEFLFTFNIKLNQNSYRYRSFGNFEDVMWNLCR